MEHPGLCSKKAIFFKDNRMFRNIVKFIGKPKPNYADIGEVNAKMEFIKQKLNISVEQIDGIDFNFDILFGRFNTIFCFEVLEHLQNPLWFMKQVKEILRKDGVLFLSSPSRPRFLWTEKHFFEMNRKHLEKWILKPLGLKIIKHKRIRINHHWTFYLKGIRPFFRIFFNYTNIYKITR